MKRNWAPLIWGTVVLLTAGAAVSALRYSRGEGEPIGGESGKPGVVTNLQTTSADAPKSLPHPLIGKMMPNVTLKNLTGEAAKLAPVAGKKLVVTFWATW